MPPILTVAIPTYGRPKQVKAIVEQLLLQKDDSWTLLVVDNHSDVPVRDLVPADVRVVRNVINIGSAGNFPRCFEMVETEWMWLLGDDDLVEPDAIKTVLSKIAQYPDAALLNFDVPAITGGRHAPVECRGMDQFLQRCDRLDYTIWMSGNIYSRKRYWPFIGMAYRFANTACGHYVLILMTLITGNTMILLPEVIALPPDEPATHGNHAERIQALIALTDLPFTRTQRHEFAKQLGKYFTKPVSDAIHCAFHIQLGADRREVTHAFLARWMQMAVARGSLPLLMGIVALRLALTVPPGQAALRGLAAAKTRLTGRPFVPTVWVSRFHREVSGL